MNKNRKYMWIGWALGAGTGVFAGLTLYPLMSDDYNQEEKKTHMSAKPLVMVQGHLDSNTIPDILTYDGQGRRGIYLGFEDGKMKYSIDIDVIKKRTLEAKIVTETGFKKILERVMKKADALEKRLFEIIDIGLKSKEE